MFDYKQRTQTKEFRKGHEGIEWDSDKKEVTKGLLDIVGDSVNKITDSSKIRIDECKAK